MLFVIEWLPFRTILLPYALTSSSSAVLSHSELRSSELGSPNSVVGLNVVSHSLYCSYPLANPESPTGDSSCGEQTNRFGDVRPINGEFPPYAGFGEPREIRRTAVSNRFVTSSSSSSYASFRLKMGTIGIECFFTRRITGDLLPPPEVDPIAIA